MSGRCDFPAPAAASAHEDLPSTEARSAYERGIAATEANDFEAARAAYARALELDPSYASAAYDLGVTFARLEKIDDALAAFARVLELDPGSVDAYYNIGVIEADRGHLEEALASLRAARALAPREFDFTKKIVQILHALGRFEDAARERLEARRIRECSSAPELRTMTAFVIDRIDIDDETVLVYEVFEPDPEWTVFYAFRVVDGDRNVRAVQLELDPASRAAGVAALFGLALPDGRHFATRHTFLSPPEYEAVRELALELVRASRGTIPEPTSD